MLGYYLFLSEENWSCGKFSSPSGVLTSPNYPSEYGNNINCSYSISLGHISGAVVVITFTDFKLDFHPTCEYDYVEVKTNY
jgi:cubilin